MSSMKSGKGVTKNQLFISIILGLSDAIRLHVSKIVQKAFVEVNEEGTEAAAATALLVEYYCRTPTFNLSKPFLFLIKDNLTQLILFAGRVGNPAEN